jgi:hypothetical protein
MLSRLACTRTFITPTLLKSTLQQVPRAPRVQIIRSFKSRAERINEKITLKEKLMAPPGESLTLTLNDEINDTQLKFQVRMHLRLEKEHSLVDLQLVLGHFASMDSALDLEQTHCKIHSKFSLFASKFL